MTKNITMPRLSETMQDGKILVWHKKANEQVNKGEIIAEVETDKANMEIEAVDSGILDEILVNEGQTAGVGETIAILDGKKKAATSLLKDEKTEKPVEKEQTDKFEEIKKEPEIQKTAKKDSVGEVSLLVRNFAEKKGVDLSKIKGSGPEGQIKKIDILQESERQENATKTVAEGIEENEKLELTKIRETIAKRMVYSKQNIPHFYLTNEVKADKLVGYYNEMKKKNPDITYNDVFIKAVSLVLKKYSRLNASFHGDYIEIKKDINIGMAIAAENGLLVPVIHNCDKKSLEEIHNSAKALKDKVKNNKLKPEDMTGGTFTISNLGMYGTEEFAAIINPPEAAGLAIGAIKKAPVIKDGEIAKGCLLKITLSGDHRAIDGVDGALFMKDLKDILENPEKII